MKHCGLRGLARIFHDGVESYAELRVSEDGQELEVYTWGRYGQPILPTHILSITEHTGLTLLFQAIHTEVPLEHPTIPCTNYAYEPHPLLLENVTPVRERKASK